MKTNWSKVDLAYAAGIIDGEGCIGIYKQTTSIVNFGHTFRMGVQVGMSDRQPVYFLYDTFGGSVYVKEGRKDGYRARYTWTIACQKARKFLIAILPYLRAKQSQAELAINFQETAVRSSIGGIPRPKTKMELQAQEVYSKMIKAIKADKAFSGSKNWKEAMGE